MDILRAASDPKVFGPAFRDKKSWQAWFAFLAALFGLPLTPEQLEVYHSCTGRELAPTVRATEGWLVCGRRAGKSFILALVAVFLSAFFDWRPYLAVGERGTIMIIAADRKQARVIMRYVRGLAKVGADAGPVDRAGADREPRPQQQDHHRSPLRIISHHPRLHHRRRIAR